MRAVRVGRALVLGCALLTLGAAPAPAAWTEPVGGSSPVNASPTQNGIQPSLVEVGGVPHVAWSEEDGANFEVRVARFDAGANDWIELGKPAASPVNASDAEDGVELSLADVGGVAHVAWREFDGTNDEVRVARFDAVANDWVGLGAVASPVNASDTLGGFTPSLADVGGVAHVAWSESDGVNSEVRVARFDAAANDWDELEGGASPVNASDTRTGFPPSLADVGGVAHVAWNEPDGVNSEVRVARFDTAANDWVELGQPAASPVNASDTQGGSDASLVDVGGVAHVAWRELDGLNSEVRVARFDAAANDWVELVGGASPVNASQTQGGFVPSLVDIGGVPHVAWTELDGVNFQVRVARFDAAANDWVELVGGASPVNASQTRHGFEPSLVHVGGVPHVAWTELDAVNSEIRVARLEPEFLDHAALPTDTGALLLAKVRTYGAAYPIGFQHGPGGFGSQTPTALTAGGQQEDTVFRQIGGLAPATAYSWRAIGFDGQRATGVGPGQAFTTTAQNGPGAQGPQGDPGRQGDPGPQGPAGPPGTAAPRESGPSLLIAIVQDRLRTARGRRVGLRYLSTAPAPVTLEVRRGRRVVARVRGRARTGRNRIAWNGSVRRRPAPPGRYTLRVVAHGADGQTDSDQVALTVVRSRR